MAAKKKSTKKSPGKKEKAFAEEIAKVVMNHGFTGNVTMTVSNFGPCPPGKVPKTVTIQTPSGKIVTKVICVDA